MKGENYEYVEHNINRRRRCSYCRSIDYQEDAVVEQKQQNTFVIGDRL
jgi:hypothetical protein